jgi:serine protease Do
VSVRLAERPSAASEEEGAATPPAGSHGAGALTPAHERVGGLGFGVRELDRAAIRRLDLPPGLGGVLVTAVDPLSNAYDAGMERDDVVLEVNRQPVRSVADFSRLTRDVAPGRVLALYCYVPELGQRALRAVRVEALPQ